MGYENMCAVNKGYIRIATFSGFELHLPLVYINGSPLGTLHNILRIEGERASDKSNNCLDPFPNARNYTVSYLSD